MADQHISVVIEYCTQCQWMLRAAWLAQELLTTFAGNMDEVTLRPRTGGVFKVFVGPTTVWDRTVDDGFPSAKELKNRIRNCALPELALGEHVDERTRR